MWTQSLLQRDRMRVLDLIQDERGKGIVHVLTELVDMVCADGLSANGITGPALIGLDIVRGHTPAGGLSNSPVVDAPLVNRPIFFVQVQEILGGHVHQHLADEA